MATTTRGDIRAAGNHTRAKTGAETIREQLEARRVWWRGRYHKTGFARDTRPTPAPGTVAARVTATDIDGYAHDALTKVCDMIGGKPDRVSWHDFGRIVAAAYAIGGRDAAYLDRIEARARFENDFGGITRDDLFWFMYAADEMGLSHQIWEQAKATRAKYDEMGRENATRAEQDA